MWCQVFLLFLMLHMILRTRSLINDAAQVMECIHQCQRRLSRISVAGHQVTIHRPSAEDVEHALVS